MAMLLTTTAKINALKEFMKEGDYDSALEIAEKIRPEKVGSVRDLMTVANAFLKKGRYEDAKDVYIEMHNHASTHKVLVGLIELCLKTNSPEEAEVYIREFRKQEPDNPERLIYRYRVDVMLGKGPEYQIRSLSKLKDEDYSDVWGLELAKAYYRMGDFEKCAQECKDVLLWFAGSDSANKAHVLLNACAERGVKISMPVTKPKEEESYEDEEPAANVPVIENKTIKEAATKEAPKEEVSEEETTEEEGFFDLSAAIGEVVSETIAEDAEQKEQEEAGFAEAAESKRAFADDAGADSSEEAAEDESTDEIEAEQAEEKAENLTDETASGEDFYDEADLEAVEDIKFSFAEETADSETEDKAAEADGDKVIEVEETETGEAVTAAIEEAVKEAAEEAIADDAEAATEAAAEEPETDTPAEDVTVDIDIIALAVKKAKEADDDDDDIVLQDYYSEEQIKEAEWEETVAAAEKKSKNAAAEASKAFYIPPLKYNKPDDLQPAAKREYAPAKKEDGIPTIGGAAEAAASEAEPAKEKAKETADSIFSDAFFYDDDFTEKAKASRSSEEEFLKSVSASVDNILSVDAEEEDGQMSFFADFAPAETETSAGDAKDDETDFSDVTDSIADSVKEDIEKGATEQAASTQTAPTKRFTEDFTAQALDAALRDDDEAIEKALYGLLSEK